MNAITETQRLINLIILTAGSYDATGQTDKRLERDFARYVKLLQVETNTTEEGALQLVINSGEAVAA